MMHCKYRFYFLLLWLILTNCKSYFKIFQDVRCYFARVCVKHFLFFFSSKFNILPQNSLNDLFTDISVGDYSSVTKYQIDIFKAYDIGFLTQTSQRFKQILGEEFYQG